MAKNLLTSLSHEERSRIAQWTGWMRRAERQKDKESDRNKGTLTKRKGKTKRDHTRGAHENRFINRSARVEWQHAKGSTIDTFPWQACNGKKNRRVVTGQAGAKVILERQRAYGAR